MYNSLSDYYEEIDKEELIKKMKKRKAENMVLYSKNCEEKKLSFEKLREDNLLAPIYRLIEYSRRKING